VKNNIRVIKKAILPTSMLRSFALIAGFCAAVAGAPAAESGHDHHSHATSGNQTMDHSRHMSMMKDKDAYQSSRLKYQLPNTRLVDADGKSTTLQKVLDYPGGVMMNFIFTSCTTICPAMSVIFSGVDKQLANSDPPVRLVSISIDPEHDTPTRLHKYAESFGARKNWLFFTGDLKDIVELQKALDVYRGNKMNHFPATFIRREHGRDWLRVEGFAGAADLVKEYNSLVARN
jgi:protein SCO1/2